LHIYALSAESALASLIVLIVFQPELV